MATNQKINEGMRNFTSVDEAIYPEPDISKEFKSFPNNTQIQKQWKN